MRLATVGSCVLCIAIGFLAGAGVATGQGKSKVTNLLHAALSEKFTPGRDVLVDLVEIPPNTALDRHWHPGEEFHYYLDGEPVIEIEGRDVARPRLGTVGHVPFETRHRASAGKAGATILVFRVHAKGQPWRYLDDGADHARDAERK